MAYGVPGMAALRGHLITEFDTSALSREETSDWAKFKPILEGADLETALQKHQLVPPLEDKLLRSVHKLISEHDQRLFRALLTNKLDLPLGRLLRFFFRTTRRQVSVVTTNYDRLIEFIADAVDIAVYTGFAYGYARRFNGEHPWRIRTASKVKPTIDLWKVHGSTDWYHTPNDTNICSVLPIGDLTEFVPLMIYPGIRKFESAWAEPYRTVIGMTDDVVQKAEAFIAVGYGFNDRHIQEKLVERIQHSRTPIICLTKQLSPSAREVLLSGRCKRFIALEESASGTRVYSESDLAGTDIPGKYWDVEGLLSLITTA